MRNLKNFWVLILAVFFFLKVSVYANNELVFIEPDRYDLISQIKSCGERTVLELDVNNMNSFEVFVELNKIFGRNVYQETSGSFYPIADWLRYLPGFINKDINLIIYNFDKLYKLDLEYANSLLRLFKFEVLPFWDQYFSSLPLEQQKVKNFDVFIIGKKVPIIL